MLGDRWFQGHHWTAGTTASWSHWAPLLPKEPAAPRGTGGWGTHHDHHVAPAALVELPHHGREVPEAVLVESEVPPGVHVVQVVPLDVLQPQGSRGPAHHPCPTTAPPCPPSLTRGKRAVVMFSTTWRVMAVEE